MEACYQRTTRFRVSQKANHKIKCAGPVHSFTTLFQLSLDEDEKIKRFLHKVLQKRSILISIIFQIIYKYNIDETTF